MRKWICCVTPSQRWPTAAAKPCAALRLASSAFQAAPGVRTPGQILAHLGDLIDWTLSLAKGNQEWHNSPPRTWDEDSARFFAALKSFDDYLASGAPLSHAA